MQSALLPVQPVCKLLAKAGSHLARQSCLKHTSLLLPRCIYRLRSTSSHQALLYSQACRAEHFSGCICEDKVTHPRSFFWVTAHPLTVQNITRSGCKSTGFFPSGQLLSFPVLHPLFCSWRLWPLLFARKMIAGGVVVLEVKLIMAFPVRSKREVQSEEKTQAGNCPSSTGYLGIFQQALPRNLSQALAVKTWLAATES